MALKLKAQELRRTLDPTRINWKQLKEKRPSRPLIGQERALKALEFGIGNKSGGFNIYVSGYPGSGKLKAVNHFLEERAKLEAPPEDWCYVNNFSDSYFPKKLKLAQGGAKIFREEIKRFIQEAQIVLISAFESKEYEEKRQAINDKFIRLEKELFEDLYKKAADSNFMIRRTPIEILVIPVDNEGRPISDKRFREFSKKTREEILNKQDSFKEELVSLLRQNRSLEKAHSNELLLLEENVALYAITTLLQEFQEKYKDYPDVLDHLEEIKNDLLNNLAEFLGNTEISRSQFDRKMDQKSNKYDVNIITDNSNLEGAPIVIELNPTYNNLFGKVEHESYMGMLHTNFSLIRGGALHRANGGYLVLPLKELLFNYFSWDSLKRALNNNEIVIEDAGERLGFLSAKSLKPDPIPLDVQVILIGSPRWYHLLYELDEEFRELFKVKAEFDTTMHYTIENVKDFAVVTYRILNENDLLPLTNEGMACLVEQASRMSGDKKKLSIKFREIQDILHEANHYATLEKKKEIGAENIIKGIEERYHRSSLIQEKINEMIKRRQLMISLQDSKIGQINAISVLDLGDIIFGRPNKITASIASGKMGLVDIERESKLGGPIHTKGVLILQGYLLEQYGQNRPLSLFGSLVFEQSYSEIEGDSASSAELYALISSLSGLPLKQGIAVTGSINQKGEVQAVGAINEKIEGYYEVCKQAGLDGNQGVIIPRSNLDNLMLKTEIIQAADEGKFHVWAVSTIDEGIEILTDHKAGRRLKDGSFSKNSVHYRVDKRLIQLNENLKVASSAKT